MHNIHHTYNKPKSSYGYKKYSHKAWDKVLEQPPIQSCNTAPKDQSEP